MLSIGVTLAVIASRLESRIAQLLVMIVAECFGVCAAQLIRNFREINKDGSGEFDRPKAEPVWHADALRNHFQIENLEMVRLGINRSVLEQVMPGDPIPRSEWYRRAAGKRP